MVTRVRLEISVRLQLSESRSNFRHEKCQRVLFVHKKKKKRKPAEVEKIVSVKLINYFKAFNLLFFPKHFAFS